MDAVFCGSGYRAGFVTSLLKAIFLFCLTTASLAQADVPWANTLTPNTPGSFPLVKPFTGEFRFGWSDIEAASAKATFSREGDRMVVKVSGGTTGFARTLWQLDATHQASFLVAGLQPVAFDQTEKYSKRTTVIKVEFRPDGVWRWRETTPGPSTARWKKVKVSPIRDMITSMLFIRSQPLRDHDKIRLIVYPGDSPFLTEVTVISHEKLKIAGKTLPAIKLDFHPQLIVRDDNHKYHLEPHRKFTRGTVWISDDEYRIPLRCEVSIFIGYVFGELKSATFADGKSLP